MAGTATTCYDSFVNQKQTQVEDNNPFRYAGEYTDLSSGLIYLRNRYYDPEIGRFISEDPIRSGSNWYIYASNNPIAFIDPLGLFDWDTRLSYNQTYNVDVEVLQNELVYLRYMDAPPDGEWGYFGLATQAAVNEYKTKMKLGNTGSDRGVVGLQTWSSLGLIHRTQADIDAGVEIVMVGRRQYFDISTPMNDLFYNAGLLAESHSNDWVQDKLKWFKSMVNHNARWDIKREGVWNDTLGISYPGTVTSPVLMFGNFTTPEELGNMLYGYTGTAAGLSETTLIAGSMYAAGVGDVIFNADVRNGEYSDHPAIRKGINWYKNGR